jgi:hypothetical protein
MKISEIISESYTPKTHGTEEKLRASVSDSMPGVFVQRQLRNTDTYMQYRYGIAVASARAVANGDVTFSGESEFAENLTQVMYTDQDEETIKLASKLFGVTPTQITTTKSQESNTINKSSPVPKKKKNKYGV